MQTILGAGGAIGIELAKSLKSYSNDIRLVSRRPKKVNDSDTLLSADITRPDEMQKAVQGSEIVYLTAGFPYNLKLWQQTWPVVMKNTIDACLTHQAKLVFFDNIYCYDGTNLNPITEELPINPPSKKGKVRAAILNQLWDAVNTKGLQALVARSADFYGPSIHKTSMLTELVIDPLSKGKKASWMSADNFLHSFTFTPDAGKATALLGNTSSAYGQVWHLPTAANPYTGQQWIEKFAAAFGVSPKHSIYGKGMLTLAGIFLPILRELKEMMYQYDRDYVFSSAKFEQHFDMRPTSYEDGILQIMKTDYGRS